MRKLLILLLLGALLLVSGCAFGTTTTAAQPTAVAGPTAEPAIVAEAVVVPVESVVLTWGGGPITELLVKENDQVAKGAPLARVDARDAQLKVEEAKASLLKAKADYDDLAQGATAEELAAANAQISQAQAQLRQAQGRVTLQDVAAAQAQLTQARERLAQLEAGPKPPERAAAQAQLDQARANLNTQRDSLSAAKTTAEQSMLQAVEKLKQSQSQYATAQVNWQYVQDAGTDPIMPTVDSKGRAVVLNEAQRQAYYDAFVQAEAQLRGAESAVEQARIAYDTARQNEVNGLAQAEALVRDAEAALAQVLSGADRDAIAAAQADVARATAELAKLRGQGRQGELDAASAQVQSAEAQLESLKAPPRATALARAQAQIQMAEVVLKQAELALDRTVLTAPIAGSVVELNLKIGQTVLTDEPAVVLAKLDSWQIETTGLTELQVVKIKVGDQATIALDALPDITFPGRITSISAIGKDNDGDMTYKVVVVPEQQDQRLRWNMSATVTIDTSNTSQ